MSKPPIVQPIPFVRALVAPLMVWGTMVGLVTWAGQPGVVCVTPMAWLLALWSGVEYARLGGGRGERYPRLAPALLGGVLGLVEGVIFIAVTSLAMPASAPGDAQKMAVLDGVAVVGGMVVCAGLASLTAGRMLRRSGR